MKKANPKSDFTKNCKCKVCDHKFVVTLNENISIKEKIIDTYDSETELVKVKWFGLDEYRAQYASIDYKTREPIQNMYDFKSIIDKYLLQNKYYSIEYKLPNDDCEVIALTNLNKTFSARFFTLYYGGDYWRSDYELEENESIIGWKSKY